MQDVFTQVINLDSSEDRLTAARAQLGKLGLSFTRTAAFDGRGKTPAELPHYSPFRARLWFGRTLTGGEVGCFLSHRACVERFLDSGASAGLVLEDDFYLCDGFLDQFTVLVDGLRDGAVPNWKLVNLGRSLKADKERLNRLTLPDGTHLCEGADFPLTTHALLWSRAGAERFHKHARYATGTVDNWMRTDMSVHGGGLFTDPPLVNTVGESVINSESGAAEIQKRGDGPRQGWYALRSRQRSRWRRAFGERRLARLMHTERAT